MIHTAGRTAFLHFVTRKLHFEGVRCTVLSVPPTQPGTHFLRCMEMGTINGIDAINLMEQLDSKKNPVPFSITYVNSRTGEIGTWKKCFLAKYLRKNPVRYGKNNPKIFKFYRMDTGEIRSLHFLQIVKINNITRRP